jgi:hypothetical protein
MASNALGALATAIAEVQHLVDARLRGAEPPLTPNPIVRALGRATVVLLSSHFERYVYAVNEEAVAVINARGLPGHFLPEDLRLVHSKAPVESMESTSWERRASQLSGFVASDSWLWQQGVSGSLEHRRLLLWMKSPKPKHLIRFYKYWGIEDIFTAITRKPQRRAALELLVKEFVDKRNNVAHGDFAEQATRLDVRRYSASALVFCRRADRALAKALATIAGPPEPW